jgi:hypothetical protein
MILLLLCVVLLTFWVFSGVKELLTVTGRLGSLCTIDVLPSKEMKKTGEERRSAKIKMRPRFSGINVYTYFGFLTPAKFEGFTSQAAGEKEPFRAKEWYYAVRMESIEKTEFFGRFLALFRISPLKSCPFVERCIPYSKLFDARGNMARSVLVNVADEVMFELGNAWRKMEMEDPKKK